MANTALSQQRLADSTHFHGRVKGAFANVAFQVIAEGRDTPTEVIRYNYARAVLANLDGTVSSTVGWLVMRTNLFLFDTTYDFSAGAVVTASGDADIESQLASDWNVLAGV